MSDITDGTLTPYLTDYKSKVKAIEAFRNGKGFVLNHFSSKRDGKPCSIRDCNSGDMVKIRYNKLAHVCFYTVSVSDLEKGTRLKVVK